MAGPEIRAALETERAALEQKISSLRIRLDEAQRETPPRARPRGLWAGILCGVVVVALLAAGLYLWTMVLVLRAIG